MSLSYTYTLVSLYHLIGNISDLVFLTPVKLVILRSEWLKLFVWKKTVAKKSWNHALEQQWQPRMVISGQLRKQTNHVIINSERQSTSLRILCYYRGLGNLPKNQSAHYSASNKGMFLSIKKIFHKENIPINFKQCDPQGEALVLHSTILPLGICTTVCFLHHHPAYYFLPLHNNIFDIKPAFLIKISFLLGYFTDSCRSLFFKVFLILHLVTTAIHFTVFRETWSLSSTTIL